MELVELVAAAHRDQTGKTLPINGTARWGTALADSDSLSIARGFGLLARTAGRIVSVPKTRSTG